MQIREEGLNQKKNQLKGWFDFLHGLNTNPRRKRRKIKDKKDIFDQTAPSHYTRIIQIGKGH